MEKININSYNARHLKAEEVADSFVISNSFRKLLDKNHSIILGARGCGKTTMMKMLTLPALHNWQHPESETIRTNISFYSIYVSTDIYWDIKNQNFGEQLSQIDNLELLISQFSVNTNVFLAICETLKNILFYEITDSNNEIEFEISKFLINHWELPKNTIPNLINIVQTLNDRIDNVNRSIQRLIFNPESEFEKHSFFYLNFETSIVTIINKFENLCTLQKEKWALCFDELEFAPLWLQEKLYTSLRSRDQRLLYKLSSSPILPSSLQQKFESDYAPSIGNDFTLIKMWAQIDDVAFIDKLIDNYVKRTNPTNDLKILFGTNSIYNKEANSYKEASNFFTEMEQLHEKDESFKSFLKERNINLDNVEFSPESNDTIFRKIKPVVYHRNYYIDKNDGNVVKYRTRKKSTDLYFGFEIISKISDGNPRWLISLLNELGITSHSESISKENQNDLILRYSNRFLNVISNIPIDQDSSFNFNMFIKKVGEYFRKDLLGSTFKMDPKNTFIVDKYISKDILVLLEKGVAQGAFIIVNSKDEDLDFDLVGKRLKFSYLLYPIFYLPLRKYEAINLSDCFSDNNKKMDNNSQMKLF